LTRATAGLVLAAGEGRRFGGPKAPFVLDGERLVDRAVRVLRDAGCEPVVVVLGAWVGRVDDADITVVNADWATGMGSSLRLGLDTLAGTEAERVVVSLVDLPGLTAEAVARLIDSGADLAQAAYQGERGHPVLIARAHWDGVAESAAGDRGARDYLATREVVLVEVGDVASGDDLDLRPA
jgi:nicotine blue oxidoreductase